MNPRLYITPGELIRSKKILKGKFHTFVITCSVLLSMQFFLLLFPPPSRLFIFLLDISASMGDNSSSRTCGSKIESAKFTIGNLITKLDPTDELMLVTYGAGNCPGSVSSDGLSWIETHPDQCGGDILVKSTKEENEFLEILSSVDTSNVDTHLSESLFKTLKYIDESKWHWKKVIINIIGDGQDHCHSIADGHNVMQMDWSFKPDLIVNFFEIPPVDLEMHDNIENMTIDGNGIYYRANDIDEFSSNMDNTIKKLPFSIILTTICIITGFIILLIVINWK